MDLTLDGPPNGNLRDGCFGGITGESLLGSCVRGDVGVMALGGMTP